jgi:hypothetical protein
MFSSPVDDLTCTRERGAACTLTLDALATFLQSYCIDALQFARENAGSEIFDPFMDRSEESVSNNVGG